MASEIINEYLKLKQKNEEKDIAPEVLPVVDEAVIEPVAPIEAPLVDKPEEIKMVQEVQQAQQEIQKAPEGLPKQEATSRLEDLINQYQTRLKEVDQNRTGAAIADSIAGFANIFNSQQDPRFQAPQVQVGALDRVSKDKNRLQDDIKDLVMKSESYTKSSAKSLSNDPNSPESVRSRNTLNSLGIKVPDTFTEQDSSKFGSSLMATQRVREVEGLKEGRHSENIGLRKDKMGFDKEKQEWKKEQTDEPSQKDVQLITDHDITLDKIEKLDGMKKEFSTGPIKGRIEEIKRFMGTASGNKTAMSAQLRDILSAYGKSVSGSAIAEPEFKRLELQLPLETDSDEMFAAKLARFKDNMDESRLRILDNIEKSGRNVNRLMNRQSMQELKAKYSKNNDSNKIESYINKKIQETGSPREVIIKSLQKSGKIGSEYK